MATGVTMTMIAMTTAVTMTVVATGIGTVANQNRAANTIEIGLHA
jgi:hypothetical protein